MKQILIMIIVLVISATLAFAQAGQIGVFSDATATSCNLADTTSGLAQLYFVHVGHAGANASQWAAPIPGCAIGWTSVGVTYPAGYLPIGDIFNGIILGYGGCKNEPTLLATANFFVGGLTGACCDYLVVPDPGIPSGLIEAATCEGALIFPIGKKGVVNPDATCDCDAPAVYESSWGRIKSLYSDE